jgi:hypothetical protein
MFLIEEIILYLQQIYSDWHKYKALFTCSSTVKPKYMKLVEFLRSKRCFCLKFKNVCVKNFVEIIMKCVI